MHHTYMYGFCRLTTTVVDSSVVPSKYSLESSTTNSLFGSYFISFTFLSWIRRIVHPRSIYFTNCSNPVVINRDVVMKPLSFIRQSLLMNLHLIPWPLKLISHPYSWYYAWTSLRTATLTRQRSCSFRMWLDLDYNFLLSLHFYDSSYSNFHRLLKEMIEAVRYLKVVINKK